MSDYYDSDYWQRIKEWMHESTLRRARREAELARAIEILTRNHADDRATECCPCCQGTGRVGIALGARDDS